LKGHKERYWEWKGEGFTKVATIADHTKMEEKAKTGENAKMESKAFTRRAKDNGG